MIIIVNIMTLCYKVIKQPVLESQHLAYMESLVRRLACPPRAGTWYLEISRGHAPP